MFSNSWMLLILKPTGTFYSQTVLLVDNSTPLNTEQQKEVSSISAAGYSAEVAL